MQTRRQFLTGIAATAAAMALPKVARRLPEPESAPAADTVPGEVNEYYFPRGPRLDRLETALRKELSECRLIAVGFGWDHWVHNSYLARAVFLSKEIGQECVVFLDVSFELVQYLETDVLVPIVALQLREGFAWAEYDRLKRGDYALPS